MDISFWIGLKLGKATSTTKIVSLSLVFVLPGSAAGINRHPAHRIDGFGLTFGAGFSGVVHD